jgi:hypothetical protein
MILDAAASWGWAADAFATEIGNSRDGSQMSAYQLNFRMDRSVSCAITRKNYEDI